MSSPLHKADSSLSSSTLDGGKLPAQHTSRGWRFWIIFFALCSALFLTALDLASISTALPAIIHDLGGTSSFVWVSSAYTLACTAVLPLSGRLADIFGRQVVLLVSIVIFGAGSVVCAAAPSMNTLIIGRTIQGVGSGAIQVLVAVIFADLIPLKDRGFFQALTGAAFSLSAVTGPFIGGAIAQRTTWRWLFYLNLPLCGFAFFACLLFLRLKKPPIESYAKLFSTIDWIGNTIIMGSATACTIGLTWAGIQFPWSSAQVLAPLVVGLFGLPAALLYDKYCATHPVVPTSIISNRTSLAGYIGSFFHGLAFNSVAFYMPTYFQAAKAASPIVSGLLLFPTAIPTAAFAAAQGVIVSKTGKYRLINAIGWCLMLVGIGLLTTLNEDSSLAVSIPFQIIAASGFGFLYGTTPVVMAPLEPEQNAAAIAFLLFVRTFSSSWAISISATILQNELHARLPSAFLSLIPDADGGHDVAYSAIPLIPSLKQDDPRLEAEVRKAFADSVRVIWQVLLGFCGAGLASVALQKHIALHTKMDEKWGMEERKRKDAETHTDADVTAAVVEVVEGIEKGAGSELSEDDLVGTGGHS